MPVPFDLGQFCHMLERIYQRPIVVRSHPMGGRGMCGIWLATDDADYVFYERNTSPLHQRHIICHEIGHVIQGHTATRTLDPSWARLLMPELNQHQTVRILGRDTYSTDNEYEAELIATLILQRAERRRRALDSEVVGVESADVLTRIHRSLRSTR